MTLISYIYNTSHSKLKVLTSVKATMKTVYMLSLSLFPATDHITFISAKETCQCDEKQNI